MITIAPGMRINLGTDGMVYAPPVTEAQALGYNTPKIGGDKRYYIMRFESDRIEGGIYHGRFVYEEVKNDPALVT